VTDASFAILDSHCHAWRRWPYEPEVPDEGSRGTIGQLLHEMDVHSVGEALVVCAAIDKNPDNVRYVAAARDRHPERIHLVADLDCIWSDTYHTPGSAHRLRALDDQYGLTGFAHYTADANDGWLQSREADEVFALAAERRILVSLGATPAWQADLRTIARRHPSVPVLCQTLGGVPATGGTDSPELRELLASADVPNIYVKVAGLHYCSARGWDYPWPDAVAVLERIASAFGPSRLCWGSDFPASTRFTTFRQSLEVVQSHCPFFSEGDLRLVLGETLRAILSHE
jgi:predicted TIM-barrel fold metal-dependent hydrolase